MIDKTEVFNYSILKLFNIERHNIEVFDVRNQNEEVIVHVQLTEQKEECPVCTSTHRTIKDYRLKKINHSTLINTKCTIEYRARRHKCKVCNKTYYEKNPFVLSGMKMSTLTVYNVIDDLKSATATFSDIALRHDLSMTTIINLFDTFIKPSRFTLPRVLCIDEVYAFKSDTSKYVCVLVDFIEHTTIDLLPTRKKLDLETYLSSISQIERDNVEIISIDMWHTYRLIAKTHFPKAKVAVDKFHVFQEFTRVMTSSRIKAMKRFELNRNVLLNYLNIAQKQERYLKDQIYYVYKKFNWLLYNKDESVVSVNKEKKWNRKLHKYANYYDLLLMMLDSSQELAYIYNFQSLLRKFYNEELSGTHLENLNMLIKVYNESNINSLIQFGATLNNWKKEIINSFIYIPEKDSKVNNAIIENRNKTIKTIKRHSNGYTNWQRFRNRVLYVTNPVEHKTFIG